MFKSRLKRMAVVFLLLFVMMFQQFTAVNAVVPSTVDYRVFLNGSKIYLYNKKAITPKNGTEVYFTYTVEDVKNTCTQQGLLLTADPTRKFPYTDGGFMRYNPETTVMMEKGSTYFIKITIASGGFRYDVTRAKGSKLEQIVFERREGDHTDKGKYVGLWFAIGNLEATLKNVRCYDKYGNDLGIGKHCGEGTADVLKQNLTLKKATDIDHRYEIKVDDKYNVAISNVKVPTTSTVYMQYKVESAEYKYNQTGIALSNSPEREYPHGKGIIKYLSYQEPVKSVDLLEVGAEYIIEIDREKNDYTVIIQKIKNGKKEIFIISKPSGEYDKNYNSVSLWFGTGERRGTFTLKDFLIYDKNRNNLGAMVNVDAEVIHSGALEDYMGCEGTYYCKETNSFIALYKDQTMKITANSSTQKGKYRVSENVLTATVGGKTQKYDYLFKRITDTGGNEYERLSTYKVSFVTGSDEKIPVQILSGKTGYQAAKPTDPKLDGCKFISWVTADQKEFDFNSVITNSVTLYAKWSGDDGKVFLAANAEEDSSNGVNPLNYVFTIGAAIIFLAGILVFILLIRKGKKNGSSKK